MGIEELSWPFTCLGDKWRDEMPFSIPLLDRLPQLLWNEKLAYLTLKFRQLSQVECPIEHIFEEGRYIREMRIPKGTLLIGRPHIYGHQCDLLSGSVIHATENERMKVDAPFTMHTTPGYQVVIYALTDVFARTVHLNNGERDISTLDADIFGSIDSMLCLGRKVDSTLRYQRMLSEAGIDESVLRPFIESEDDQIRFPQDYCVEVRPSQIHGQGLHATASIMSGAVIAPARIREMRTPAGRYTNHSNAPNAVVVPFGEIWSLVASRDITAGEEILIDYRRVIPLHERSMQ